MSPTVLNYNRPFFASGESVIKNVNCNNSVKKVYKMEGLIIILLCLVIITSNTNPESDQLISPRSRVPRHRVEVIPDITTVYPTTPPKPIIESLGNVTILVGQRGELKCRVDNLGNYTVTVFFFFSIIAKNCLEYWYPKKEHRDTAQ